MVIPEYTVSLLIWIVPIGALEFFFIKKRLLSPEKSFALIVTVAVLAAIGIVLDLLFAKSFFLFPNARAVLGISIKGIPVEEFVFYVAGFWFVIFIYVFCDEYFLKKYNVSDKKYARFRARLKRTMFVHINSAWHVVFLVVVALVAKRFLNPTGGLLPGYFVFLAVAAYMPSFLFYRVTKLFVNWRAFIFSMLATVLISIIWEVTLALPRGYWDYQHGAMLGIFIGVWHDLPIEAITVWIFCTLVIMFYEYVKICYFTDEPSVPGHKLLLKVGREWRKKD
jgi:hypothetical protein